MELERKNYSSGSAVEEKSGYSRMVEVGPFIYLAGTTAVKSDGTVHGEGNPYEQTKFIIEKLIDIMGKANAGAKNVTRIKVYTTDMSYAPEIAKAYSEYFFDIKPVLTMVGINMLNRPTQLVEIEMDAIKY